MLQVFHALLSGDRLLAPFASPCIGLCPLSANRQPLAVTHSAITLNLAKPANVLLNLAPKRTLNGVILVEMVRNPADFVFRQFTRPLLRINPELVTDLDGKERPDPVQIAQRNMSWFVIRNVYAEHAGHLSTPERFLLNRLCIRADTISPDAACDEDSTSRSQRSDRAA